jgi:hypothetical protein
MGTVPQPSGPQTRRLAAPAWLVLASLAWAALVLAVYYRQVWWMVSADAAGWDPPGLELYRLREGLPYAREAAQRASRAIAGATMVWLSAIALGSAILPLLAPPTTGRGERIVFTAALGIGLLSYLLLGLAFLGAYTPRVVTACLVAGTAAGLVMVARADLRGAARRGRDLLLEGGWPDAAWKLATLAALGVAGLTALAPEIEYDALWYHLGLPKQWLSHGGPVDNVHDYVSLYPLTWDLVFGAATVVGGPPAASLVHWGALPAAAVAAGLIAGRIGASPWLAGAVAVTAPTVVWQASTTYVDLALALHVALGTVALFRFHDSGDHRWLVLAGLQFGLACATKHLGIVATLVATALAGAVVLRRDGFAPAMRLGLVVGALALVPPLPWYLRAWAASGNPFSPEMYSVFGSRPPERWNDIAERGHQAFKARFGRPRTAANLARLPWDVTMHGTRYGGSFGPMVLLLTPGLVLVALKRPAAGLLVGGTIIYLAIWASPISSYQARFLVPTWLVLAPVVALAYASLVERARRHPTAVAAGHVCLLLLLLANLPPFTKYHEGDRVGWDGWLTHVVRAPPLPVVFGAVSERAYLREQIRSFRAWEWIEAHVPVEAARVLTFSGGDDYYTRHARLWSESVVAWPAVWGAIDVDGALAALARLSITHVLAPAPPLRDARHDALPLLRAAADRRLERVYADYWYEVYRVSPASASTTDQR